MHSFETPRLSLNMATLGWVLPCVFFAPPPFITGGLWLLISWYWLWAGTRPCLSWENDYLPSPPENDCLAGCLILIMTVQEWFTHFVIKTMSVWSCLRLSLSKGHVMYFYMSYVVYSTVDTAVLFTLHYSSISIFPAQIHLPVEQSPVNSSQKSGIPEKGLFNPQLKLLNVKYFRIPNSCNKSFEPQVSTHRVLSPKSPDTPCPSFKSRVSPPTQSLCSLWNKPHSSSSCLW